ncbi:MAG: ornithine cyclodeaminase family protein [Fimbriimonadales bacterium]|nr:ornithine cyclodeaminase family protein [Fimbriimonadales bacterium]
MPLLLTRSDVEALLTMELAVEATRSAFCSLHREQVELPERLIVDAGGEGTHLSMPCFVTPDSLAIKIVTVFPKASPAIRGLAILHSSEDGSVLAIMDAEHLTAMRTAAASALATSLLARSDSRTLAVFGAGAQARSHIAAMKIVRSIERVLIVNRTRSHAETLANEIGAEVADAESALSIADIVCTTTDAPAPLFDGDLIRPGTHINAVGSYRPNRRELDEKLIERARVFVDHIPASKAAGEFALASNWSWDKLAGTLGSLIEGDSSGRSTPEEITVFKSVGIAVQDAACAKLVYERAIQQSLGAHFDFER